MFNSLVAKEEETVKMMEDSTCEAINTGTINIAGRNGMVHVLESVRYIPEVWYNLTFIRVLDSEGSQIQVQHRVVTVSQGDRIILKGEKFEGIYKLKETQFKVEFQWQAWKGAHRQVKLHRRLRWTWTRSKCYRKEKWRIREKLEMAQGIAWISQDSGGGARIKVSRFGYNQWTNQDKTSKFLTCFV